VFTLVRPLPELGFEIGAVIEATTAEEAALTQPTRFSTVPFCCPERGQHSSEAVVERDLAKDCVPDDQVAPAAEDDRRGIVLDQ
jgi:hypothetical protein